MVATNRESSNIAEEASAEQKATASNSYSLRSSVSLLPPISLIALFSTLYHSSTHCNKNKHTERTHKHSKQLLSHALKASTSECPYRAWRKSCMDTLFCLPRVAFSIPSLRCFNCHLLSLSLYSPLFFNSL